MDIPKGAGPTFPRQWDGHSQGSGMVIPEAAGPAPGGGAGSPPCTAALSARGRARAGGRALISYLLSRRAPGGCRFLRR